MYHLFFAHVYRCRVCFNYSFSYLKSTFLTAILSSFTISSSYYHFIVSEFLKKIKLFLS